VVTCSADGVCVRAPEIFCSAGIAAIRSFAQRVFALGEVCQLDVDLRNGVGTIRFEHGVDIGSCLLRLAEQLRVTSMPIGEVPLTEPAPGVEKLSIARPIARRREMVSSWQIIEQGLRRLTYLSLAGASFAVAVVGVAVPGIPTVPFLLVSSYFLVRSSPPLHQRLLRSRVFGPLLRDWHRHRALRRSVKVFALATLVVVVIVSVLVAGLTLPAALVVVLLALFGVWMILRIPSLEGGRIEEVPYLALA
jgi:uncharacterized membrane protein YbaN (DUF454 family)